MKMNIVHQLIVPCAEDHMLRQQAPYRIRHRNLQRLNLNPQMLPTKLMIKMQIRLQRQCHQGHKDLHATMYVNHVGWSAEWHKTTMGHAGICQAIKLDVHASIGGQDNN